jgi:hypothetical protein
MVAESLSDNDNIGCTMCVPRFAIVKLEVLRVEGADPAPPAPAVPQVQIGGNGTLISGAASPWTLRNDGAC